jgi:hypothetical protein
MQNKSHLIDGAIGAAAALLAIIFLIACQQAQQPTSTTTPPAETKPATSDVFVVFEGPWAIVPDPKDNNNVLAIAPKTKSHRDLGVVPANTTLAAGVYDLSLPYKSSGAAPTFDKDILRADVQSQSAQRAVETRGDRYVIRLPKPIAYVAETRYPSRVGDKYPPDPTTEHDYATAVALRYDITSKTGFSLAGTPDVGAAFKPVLFEVNTESIRFTIDPVEMSSDECNTHSRSAFHELTRLLGVTLYVDFPGSPEGCHKKDPQLGSKTALLGVPFEGTANSYDMDARPQMAGMSSGMVERGIEAAIYFFHSGGGACRAPIIVGGGG